MDFIEVDVEAGPNCDLAVTRMFEALEPPREARWVAAAFRPDGWEGACDLTGWADGAPAPAMAAKVSDSGDGVVTLVYGGGEGLRLRPAGSSAEWSLDDPAQWGEPCLLLDAATEVR